MSAVAPLLMALIGTDQLYWENAFFAQVSKDARPSYVFQVFLLLLSLAIALSIQAANMILPSDSHSYCLRYPLHRRSSHRFRCFS